MLFVPGDSTRDQISRMSVRRSPGCKEGTLFYMVDRKKLINVKAADDFTIVIVNISGLKN